MVFLKFHLRGTGIQFLLLIAFLMCSKLEGSSQRILKTNLNTTGDLL